MAKTLRVTYAQRRLLLKYRSNPFKLSSEEKEFQEKITYNLEVISNYHLDTLEETNIHAFYYGSSNLGQSISICRRKSFYPSLKHLTPYYSLNELIKMGQNMNMIEKKITPVELQNEKLHYQVCKEISKNDIYAKEIITHQNYLKDYYNLITFFSIYGSYVLLKLHEKHKTSINCYFTYIEVLFTTEIDPFTTIPSNSFLLDLILRTN